MAEKRVIVQVRRSVFETASSSLHALAIHTDHSNNPPLEPEYSDECIHVVLDDYISGPEKYRDLYHKVSYLLTFIKCTEYRERFREVKGRSFDFNRDTPDMSILMDTPSFARLDREITMYCGYRLIPEDPYNAEVDHQALDHARTVDELMVSWGCDLHDFLFDTAYELVITYDTGPFPSVEEVESYENADKWVKYGNDGIAGFAFPVDTVPWWYEEDYDDDYDTGDDENITSENQHPDLRGTPEETWRYSNPTLTDDVDYSDYEDRYDD